MLLIVASALVASAVPAAASAAIPAPFPVGTNWILSGTPTLDAGIAAPVSDAYALSESVSDDGRYVAFVSGSDGLATLPDTSSYEVFVKDRQTGAVTLVSRESGVQGTPARGTGCDLAVISGDGSTVAMECQSALTGAAVASGTTAIYARNWQSSTPVTSLVASNASTPTIDKNGGLVAFVTIDALDPVNDTDATYDVYRASSTGGSPVVVSRLAGGGAAAGSDSFATPSISDDGNEVAYVTTAPALTGSSSATPQAAVIVAGNLGTTGSASTNESPCALHGSTTTTSRPCTGPVLSGDGTHVAFTTDARLNATEDASSASLDVYVRTLGSAHQTHLVSANVPLIGQALPPTTPRLELTADAIDATGRHVEFTDTASGAGVFVRDMTTSTPTRVSLGQLDAPLTYNVEGAGLSADGSIAAFIGLPSSALAISDTIEGSSEQLYVRAAGGTEAVSRPAGSAPFVNGTEPYPAVILPSTGGQRAVSADGARVVFVSAPSYFSYDGRPSVAWMRDTRTGDLTAVSRADGTSGAIDTGASQVTISADGTHVAWVSTNAVDPRDTNSVPDVYVRDLTTGTTVLASRPDRTLGGQTTSASSRPSLDADGGRVAFVSYSDNLVDHDTNLSRDVFLRDLATSDTTLVSAVSGTTSVGDDESSDEAPSISADGNQVAFTSYAELAPTDTNTLQDVYVRNLTTAETTPVSVNSAGSAGGGTSPDLSADGTKVVFLGKTLSPGDPTRGSAYLRDRTAGTTTLVNRGGTADLPADRVGAVSIDATGRYVAFTAPDDFGTTTSNTAPYRGWLRDLQAGTTSLALQSASGDPTPSSDVFFLTSGATCAVFFTNAPTIAAPATQDYAQLYLRALKPGCVPALPGAGNGGGDATNPAPTPTPVPVVGAAGPPLGPTTPRDTTKPVLSAVKLSPTSFLAAHTGDSVATTTAKKSKTKTKAKKTGSVVSYALSEPAAVVFTIGKATAGLERGKSCVTATAKLRKAHAKRCTFYKAVSGSFKRTVAKAGTDSFTFSGRLVGHTLAKASYQLTITATDAAGNVSTPATKTFKVTGKA